MNLQGYEKAISEIDPDINPVGVEAAMRQQYGVLNDLSSQTFWDEVRLARDCEQLEPGYLREAAEAQGTLERFEEWERDRGRTQGQDT